MSIKYATIRQDGVTEIREDSGPLPEGAIELSDQEYEQLKSNQYVIQNGAIVPYTPPAPTVDPRDQIESVSNAALRSGVLYELVQLAMDQFMAWAKSQNPDITEADLITEGGPYYSVGYAKNKALRDQLLALVHSK